MDIGNNLIKRIEKWATVFFFAASVFVMFSLTQALILTWLDQFKIFYLLLSILISSILTCVFIHLIKPDINRLPRVNIPILIIIIIVSLIGIFFPHDSFGGRDEGNYSGLAIILSKYQTISIPLYLRQAPLAYDSTDQNIVFNSTTPLYISWLAAQKVLFGIKWMLRSNIVLVSLGLCSLYLASSLFIKKRITFIVVALYSSCMPFLWFFRETMTENLAFFLLWTSIVFLFTFFRTKRNIYLVGLILGMWLFSFTRLEGILIQITTFLVFSAILLINKTFSLKRKLSIILIYLVIIISTVLATKSFSHNSYITDAISDVEGLSKKSIPSFRITESIKKYSESVGSQIKLADRMPVFIMQMLAKYNLTLILFSVLLIIPLILLDKKMANKSKIYLIGLLIIISPEFYKFINPAATLEQPWMYRRYLYALLPAGYLCFWILLNKLMNRKLLVSLFSISLIINLLLSNKIITLKNNWQITEKIEKITRSISSDDFVIIKNRTILDDYYPQSFLAYHKLIRNLYTDWIESGDWIPKEKKYQGMPYSRLFILSDKEEERYKDFKLEKIGAVEIESRQLQQNCKLPELGDELKLITSDMGRLPYLDVIKYCSKTDNEIIELKKKIFLYELIN